MKSIKKIKKKNLVILFILIISFFLVPVYLRRLSEKSAKRSIKDFQTALDYYDKAFDEYENNNPEEVIRLCTLALGKSPENMSIKPYAYNRADIYSLRGMAYKEKGELEKAENDFSMIIEINPNEPRVLSAYKDRGSVRAELGNYKEAMDDFSKSLEIDNEFWMTYYERGLARLRFGKIELGCKDLEKAGQTGVQTVQDDFKKYCSKK